MPKIKNTPPQLPATPWITVLQQMPRCESRAVQWARLIVELEAFRLLTGWGLAGIWGHVHAGDYEEARRRYDGLRALLGEFPVPSCDTERAEA